MQVQVHQSADKILELAAILNHLPESDLKDASSILSSILPVWVPLWDAPQQEAFDCKADILYFGGAAGGSKSDLLLGLALTKHQKSIIFRRESTQLLALTDRMAEILGTRQGWNGKDMVWRLPNRPGCQVEFGSAKDPGDEIKWQGRPHDFVGFDEITHFLEAQFRFFWTWLRSIDPLQRCRIVCAGNPPTNEEGQWVIQFWGPWLDDKHPRPAKPGELRWYTTINGKDVERPNGDRFWTEEGWVTPLSRTFIPSYVQDNPFLSGTNYLATLQALPEPLRSQMLRGDFKAGMEDSAWQVIPTGWVDEAMKRWTPNGKSGFMDSVGVDVARGGRDKTIISCRYGKWFSPLLEYPGPQTPDGGTTAGLVISAVRDHAPIHVDVIGVGGSVVDHLKANNIHAVAVNNAEAAPDGQFDRNTGRLKFRNMRALTWWRLREYLEPKIGSDFALPPDPELKADLCAPHWDLTPHGIVIESKEQMIHGPRPHKLRPLGRSPDKGDAVVLASISTPKTSGPQHDWRKKAGRKGSWVTA